MATVVHKGAAATATEGAALRRLSTFHSLRYSDYRYLWQGQVGASASQWMEQVARPLLILQLTDSALAVGLLQATRMVPQLVIGVWAGVMADRMDKRKILLISQTITFVTQLATAALVLSGTIAPWMVFLTTFITGSSMAFNQPARQSLIPRIVPDESMANAVALNSAALNIMRIGGPTIAGVILIFFSLGELYVVQSVIYVWVLFSTARIRVRTQEAEETHGSMREELFEGFGTVKRDPVIFYILILSLVIFIWGVPYQSVFVPLIAKRELGLGDSGLGILISTVGIGALIGSLTIATIGDRVRGRGWIMLGMLMTFSVGLLLLSQARSIAFVVPCLIITGAMQTSFMSLNNAYVLGRTPMELQGRVMSLFSLDRGLVPLGATIAGFLAEALSPSAGLLIMGGICLACTLLLTVVTPALRRIS